MANSKKSSKRKTKPSLLNIILGLLLFVAGIVLIINKEKSSTILSSTFRDEPIKFEQLKLNDNILGDKPERILVPNLKIDLRVKEAKVVEGFWEVFNDSAGWGEGSGYPGLKGNQVIFAHAREGLFLPLRSIKLEDKILVLTKDKYYEYKVVNIKEVRPNETEVIKGTEDETLTLYTCSGFSDSKRLVVIGKRSQ